jgi:hypothetical protein
MESVHSHPLEPMPATSTASLTAMQIQALTLVADALYPRLSVNETQDYVKSLPQHLSFIRENSPPPASLADAADYVVPTIDDIRAFAQRGVDNTPGAMDAIVATLYRTLPVDKVQLMGMVLDLLQTRYGTALLTFGKYGLRSAAFVDLPLHDRQCVLLSFCNSIVPQKRLLFQGFKSLILFSIFALVDEKRVVAEKPDQADEMISRMTHSSVIWKAMGYPGPDPRLASHAWTDLTHPAYTFLNERLFGGDAPSTLSTEGKVARPLDSKPVVLEYDAVVIGSGAGGGVVASMLANGGFKTLVIEKGSYVAQKSMTLLERDLPATMERGGMLSSEDGSVTILAGQTYGGGKYCNVC